ncbi:MAG: OmpA family protein [Treponema sp.]|jgi:outer membrane protein OmpA-like peptidoglycan-associated protein|nr:OmpA family protein [Treponema sp.]
MKRIFGFVLVVFVLLVSCVTPSTNPGVNPEVAVEIPELFSPDLDSVNYKMPIAITVNHPVAIKEWTIQIQPLRQAQRQSTQEGDQAPRQRTPFFEHSGRGTPPSTWAWDGKSTNPRRTGEMLQSATDYMFSITVTDIFGNTTTHNDGVITSDVLVVRDGDNLRIIVPSIMFPGNSSDLNQVSEEDRRANTRVLRLIANALNKYPNYRVVVEGHANPATAPGTRERTNEENIIRPISEQRARAVVDYLVTNHSIARSRLSFVGLGATRTVADYTDDDENWKNRRVEFLLQR